jgi:hypothetical protein
MTRNRILLLVGARLRGIGNRLFSMCEVEVWVLSQVTCENSATQQHARMRESAFQNALLQSKRFRASMFTRPRFVLNATYVHTIFHAKAPGRPSSWPSAATQRVVICRRYVLSTLMHCGEGLKSSSIHWFRHSAVTMDRCLGPGNGNQLYRNV